MTYYDRLGRRYRVHSQHKKFEAADKVARKLRRKDFLARIAKSDGSIVVYARRNRLRQPQQRWL